MSFIQESTIKGIFCLIIIYPNTKKFTSVKINGLFSTRITLTILILILD